MSYVTLKDIAAHLGLSIATVSRALNQKPGISAASRAKILEAAKEMGYSPDFSAQALVTNRLRTIGCINFKYPPITSIDQNFHPMDWMDVAQGIDNEITKRKYHMLNTFIDQEAVNNLEIPAMVLERRVDGIILNGAPISIEYIRKIQKAGFPVVLINNAFSNELIDSVAWDNENGAYQAVKHLIDHGHKHIGFLSGPLSWLSSCERSYGYRRAIEDAGLKPRIFNMIGTTAGTGKEAMLSALENYPELTAMMTANDMTAIGAILACRQKGRSVPEEVAIIGFGDISLAQMNTPPLTTLHVSFNATGKYAAQRLLQLINEQDNIPIQIRIPVKLIVRQSCGCKELPT